jgi:hypothetical protein
MIKGSTGNRYTRTAPPRALTCAHCGEGFESLSSAAKWCTACTGGPADPERYYASVQRLKKYDLSYPEFVKMLVDQDGECAMCTVNAATDVDHCHTTGKVRGLLCRACNRFLGMYEVKGAMARSYLLQAESGYAR